MDLPDGGYLDEILLTELCTCRNCKNILEPPVMLTKERGNVCSSCFEALKCGGFITGEHAMENVPVEIALRRKRFPCVYEGCDEKLLPDSLKVHQELCSYRTIPCVFSPTCVWIGRKTQFASHLLTLHNEYVISNYSDAFSIPVPTQDDCDSLHILDTSSGPFVCRIKTNWIMNFIYCKIYNSQPYSGLDEKHNLMFKICFEDDTFCSLEFSCLVLNKVETFQNFDLDEATVIDTKKLPPSILQGDYVRHIIKFEDRNETVHLNTASLRMLECPVCNYLMRPPISQCITGHSLCSNCFPNLAHCPTCRGPLGDTRNYLLEELVDKMKYPCINRDFGCQIISTSISTHEASCSYKRFGCVFSNCDFKGRYSELICHVKEKHGQFCKQLPTVTLGIGTEACTTRMCTIVWGHIFKITTKITAHTVYWAVEVVRKQIGGPEFVFAIALKDSRRAERKISISDRCHSVLVGRQDDVFDKWPSLPLLVVKKFAQDNTIPYTVKIGKQKD